MMTTHLARTLATHLARTLATLLAALAVTGCATPTGAVPPSLVGPVWQWRETLMNDDKRTVAPAPERYKLQFLAVGTARVLADCNRGSGRYEAGPDRRLAIGRVATTRMMCPPGSEDATFLHGLTNVSGYLFDGADLVLMLKFDSGTLRFRPGKQGQTLLSP